MTRARHVSPGGRRVGLWLAVLAACGAEPEPGVRVGPVAYPADQVARLTPQQLRSLADVSAFGAAIARGEFGGVRQPAVERAAERSRIAGLPWALAARELEIGDAELRTAYAEAPEWELTVRHLVLLVPRWARAAERQAAWARAEQARRRALEGGDFGAVADEYSEEPGAAERGGLLQPGRRGTWVEPFWEAALALQPGEISPVVETEYGFHVLQLEDREPIRFEEADRARLLRRLIPEERASVAMERWLGEQPAVLQLDRSQALTARALLQVGEAPETLVVAHWSAPDEPEGRYTARDLALYRAALDGEELDRLDRADDDGFLARIESDAREAKWADAARRLGVSTAAGATAEAERRWEGRSARWAEAFGFRRGMGEPEIAAAALRALAAAGQEARIARLELAGLRPLLWPRYPVSAAELGLPATPSNSPTP
jgi:hypothetical protein